MGWLQDVEPWKVLLPLGLVVVLLFALPGEDGSEPAREPAAVEDVEPQRDEFAASVACEQFLDRRGDVEHGDWRGYRVTETAGGWIVLGELDDGTGWRCEVDSQADGWTLVDLDVDR